MARLANINIRNLMLLALILLISGCSKDDGLVISGTISDPNQSIKVNTVLVQVWTQRIISGLFEADYKLAGEQLTGADGKFEIDLLAGNYTGIKLILSKSGYFGSESMVNLADLSNNQSHNKEYQLLPKAWLIFHVNNREPFDSGDYFDFRLSNPYTNCEECCKGNDYEFVGMDINQTVSCISAGHQDLIFQWTKRKNKEQIVKTETIFIKAFDTTRIELIY